MTPLSLIARQLTMRPTEIKQAVREAETFVAESHLSLQPFSNWSPGDWKAKRCERDEIRGNMLGWAITDFGRSNFRECGPTLTTIRNGGQLIVGECQRCPCHLRWKKREDLIHRGDCVPVKRLFQSLSGAREDEHQGGAACALRWHR